MRSLAIKEGRPGVLLGLVIVSLALFSACSPSPQEPTITPRPTLAREIPPTPLPAPVQAGQLIAGEARAVTLPGGAFVVLEYQATEPQRVVISAVALTDDGAGNTLDPILEVLDANADQIVYSDDIGAGVGGLESTDAYAVVDLQAGEYRVRVNSFNGAQRGDIEIILEIID